jgi:hypothetical protein
MTFRLLDMEWVSEHFHFINLYYSVHTENTLAVRLTYWECMTDTLDTNLQTSISYQLHQTIFVNSVVLCGPDTWSIKKIISKSRRWMLHTRSIFDVTKTTNIWTSFTSKLAGVAGLSAHVVSYLPHRAVFRVNQAKCWTGITTCYKKWELTIIRHLEKKFVTADGPIWEATNIYPGFY